MPMIVADLKERQGIVYHNVIYCIDLNSATIQQWFHPLPVCIFLNYCSSYQTLHSCHVALTYWGYVLHHTYICFKVKLENGCMDMKSLQPRISLLCKNDWVGGWHHAKSHYAALCLKCLLLLTPGFMLLCVFSSYQALRNCWATCQFIRCGPVNCLIATCNMRNFLMCWSMKQ